MRRAILPPLLLLTLFARAPGRAADDEPSLTKLYTSGALFDRKQYKAVRAAFAADFARRHARTLAAAFAGHPELPAWLDKRPEIKEELFTALSDPHDDLAAALRLFARLWKDHPSQIEALAPLAIATAVTWDRPGGAGGVYDYRHHQVRTRSTMPAKLADAAANFAYFADDAKLAAAIKPLPWELLVFVIDHRTPVEERRWAQKYFAARSGKVSSWHQDVAYDHGMLKTEKTGKGPGPKLAGHEYTLANIKRYGGVCAQQADFVARVGKSLGQPSVYVSGESSYRGWHAWVMWVNVTKGAKGAAPKFSLTSDGRTRGFERDAFYVGHLRDPQTGERLTDRDLERRLEVITQGPLRARQVRLAMRGYEAIAREAKLDAKAKVAYLDRALQLAPAAEGPWLELARLAKEGELSGAARAAKLAALTRAFARHPDFVARLSDDFLTGEPAAAKIKHYAAVVAMYEKAARPDLACDGRLKLAAAYGEGKKYKEAAAALTAGVRKFPTEGRFIPRLLKAYEKVCEDYPAGVAPLGNLYVELAPALLRHYKGESNAFLDAVLEQARAFCEANGLTKQAAALKARVGAGKSK